MPILLIGLLVLILAVYALRELGRAPPAQVANGLRNGGGVMALAAAALLALRGRLSLAAGFGFLSFFLFTGQRFSIGSFWSALAEKFTQARKDRRRSHAHSALLDMVLDHATGEVDGTILAGPMEGRRLSQLALEECVALLAECRARDAESGVLLEAYLDRRFAGWRAAGQGDAHAGRQDDRRSRSGEMSEQEAYETLGLRPGAAPDEIVRAHRRLMKERHPDHGGTTDDAARINQAKDRLLRRHG